MHPGQRAVGHAVSVEDAGRVLIHIRTITQCTHCGYTKRALSDPDILSRAIMSWWLAESPEHRARAAAALPGAAAVDSPPSPGAAATVTPKSGQRASPPIPPAALAIKPPPSPPGRPRAAQARLKSQDEVRQPAGPTLRSPLHSVSPLPLYSVFPLLVVCLS